MSHTVTYKPAPTSRRFMQSDARRRIMRGPFRSGKSVTCCMEIARRAAQQAPGPDGIRRTRWAVVRNTMRQLLDTTIKTWLDWFPDGVAGRWVSTTKTFILKYGDVHAEVMFRALDDAADLANVLSLEVTGVYLNECREITREIAEALDGRIGQYPRMQLGGPTWKGIWADTNPPTEGTYWHSICEKLHPDSLAPDDSWEVFTQPSGLAPDAENVENLAPNYYLDLAQGKSDEFIRVYIKNEYGKSMGGKPVHPLFAENVHVATSELLPNPMRPLVLSADFGRTPAIAFLQEDVFGRLLLLDEVVTEGMSLDVALTKHVKPLVNARFKDYDITVTGDPSGAFPGQTDEATCVTIFKRHGYRKVRFSRDRSNNMLLRRGALDTRLGRRPDAGGFLVDPRCKVSIRGLSGGFRFKQNKQGVVAEEPEKNIFSHICEAIEYGAIFYEEPPQDQNRDRRLAMIAAAQRAQAQQGNAYSLRR